MNQQHSWWQPASWSSWLGTPVYGLDLGSSQTRLTCGKKVIFQQSTCLVVHQPSKSVLELGTRAYSLSGRTPEAYQVIFPVKRGLVSDPEAARSYLEAVLNQQAHQNWWQKMIRPSVVCAVPELASELDKRTLKKTVQEAGFGAVTLLNKADLYRSRIGLAQPESAVCVLDVGAHTTEVVFYAGAKPMVTQTVLVGGQTFTQLIQQAIRTEYQCEIGMPSAEKLKFQLAALKWQTQVKKQDTKLVVRGKSVVHNIPTTVTVSTQVLSVYLEQGFAELLEEVKNILSRVPSELLTAAFGQGLYLMGGSSNLEGLRLYLANRLESEVSIVPHPDLELAKGLMAHT